MSERFHDRYRIPSARASWWNYGRNGAYFVTICTADRECYFGNIVDTLNTNETLGIEESLYATSLHIQNILSPIGEIAQSCWQEILQHFPYVQLDSFIIMPNHVHGIIIVDKRIGMMVENESVSEMGDGTIENSNDVLAGFSTNVPVETRLIASLQSNPTVQSNSAVNRDQNIQNQQSIDAIKPEKLIGGITGDNNPMMHDNLSRIVRWNKGRTTFESHKINPSFTCKHVFMKLLFEANNHIG